jgi:LysR family cys regulon transcriptional activator
MNFQQLRSIREAARCGFNLTEVANVLFTSQPGVSRQIRELEEELGVDIFIRNGKRLIGLTDPGTLTVAATHTQARYALPRVVQGFRASFPDVRIALQQSSPEHIADWVISGKADVGIATEGLTQFKELISFPCYEWSHVLVVPENHPLLDIGGPVSLADLAAYPLITYDIGFTGRGHIDDAFRTAGITPDIVLTAMDSDVIQQYVSLGLGVGLVASMATEHSRQNGLRSIEVSHLLASNVTRLAVRRGAYLRSYTYDFILQFAPQLKREDIVEALQAEPSAGSNGVHKGDFEQRILKIA